MSELAGRRLSSFLQDTVKFCEKRFHIQTNEFNVDVIDVEGNTHEILRKNLPEVVLPDIVAPRRTLVESIISRLDVVNFTQRSCKWETTLLMLIQLELERRGQSRVYRFDSWPEDPDEQDERRGDLQTYQNEAIRL
ncbi:hypothetical protein BT96DRAFT_988321 [Gymnopus androsaceus JB14]|uniref:Uncharacterized protein n=1 Tax=Gymnopus androsaceus JB14 TaxID=1447944 RepID=A0A6A4I4T7_9AGAR|nr:hypothetical protein BT96DRAFT_988321 [Gymnopus androsaceus JB14]